MKLNTLAIFVALATSVGSVPALAQTPQAGDAKAAPRDEESSREHFNSAVRFSKEGKYKEALEEFQRAYDANPSWKLLYNIGVSARQARDEARSVTAFERYLSEGGTEISKQRRTEVETALRELRSSVGTIDVSVNVAGASVLLDDKKIGVSPLTQPILANAGHHKVTVSTGALSVDRDITLNGGGSVKVDILLLDKDKGSGPNPPGTATGKTPAPPVERNPWVMRGWIATGALAVGGAATGIAALVASKSLQHSTYAWTDPDFRKRATTINTLATVTDVLLVSAAALAGVTLYLTIARPNQPSVKGDKSLRSSLREAAPDPPKIVVGLGGASLVGSF